jgi:hypothetical protein
VNDKLHEIFLSVVSLCINEVVKPFKHDEFLKKTFANCAEAFFNDFKNNSSSSPWYLPEK